MKLVRALSTAVLSLTFGVGVPVYAQQEQHEQQEEQKDKPAHKVEKKALPEKPAKQEEKNARQEDKNTKPEEKNAQQEKNSKEAKNAQEHTRQAQPEQQMQRAGGNGGGRIPDDRFRADFGREHRFHISENDYRRDRRFQYGGYWFGFVQPWPSNWLYTEDVFVVEIDGVYYLCNANYPGVNIALSVTM